MFICQTEPVHSGIPGWSLNLLLWGWQRPVTIEKGVLCQPFLYLWLPFNPSNDQNVTEWKAALSMELFVYIIRSCVKRWKRHNIARMQFLVVSQEGLNSINLPGTQTGFPGSLPILILPLSLVLCECWQGHTCYGALCLSVHAKIYQPCSHPHLRDLARLVSTVRQSLPMRCLQSSCNCWLCL